MFTRTNKFAVRVLRGSSIIHLMLAVVLALSSTMILSSSRAEAYPSGHRLPFNGYAEISAGPRCYQHWGMNLEAIDFVWPNKPNQGRGTPVYAVQSGSAQVWLWDPYGGRMIRIYHNDGTYSEYAHLDSISLNYSGWVNKGQQIGTVGDSGNASGVHLHYAVRWTSNGQPVRIHDHPSMVWWERNPATQTCVLNGRNEGSAYGP